MWGQGKPTSRKRRAGRRAAAAFALLIITPKLTADSLSNTQESLQQVETQIRRQQQDLEQSRRQEQQASEALRALDESIGNLAGELHISRQQQRSLEQRTRKLEQQQQQLTHRIAQQSALLARQLDAAYRRGPHDSLRLLLEQEKAAQSERVLGYWHYLNQARQQAIKDLKTSQQALETNQRELARARLEASELVKRQQDKNRQLSAERARQAKQLQTLAARQRSTQERLNALLNDQAGLQQALEQALQARNAKLDGLAKLKGKLSWPVDGRLSHRFGALRQGEVKWNGIVLDANEGSPVRSVHRGEVLFAEWMRGFGLVMVIDHGEGYLSLYAHNQSLLRQVGERVEAGEPIALVGRSGGSSRPGLYFELRHQGQAIDPAKWLSRG